MSFYKIEDAEKVWCPATFSASEPPSHCVTDKCMAWRWNHRTLVDRDADGKMLPDTIREERTVWGYCGLGGRP